MEISFKNQKQSFFKFIVNERSNRRYLVIALLGCLLQFIFFKLLYPYADFFSDSYSYIFAASKKLDVNIWPIGYSKLLWIFHSLMESDTALVAFQYFFLMFALLAFYFTLLYFYQPSIIVTRMVFIFLFFNPLFLYLSNYISSDPLFIGISVLWMTQLLWIVYQPKGYQIWIHAFLLLVAFTFRYNALYYPIVGAVAYGISNRRLSFKLAGITSGVAVIVFFMLYTSQKNKELTGIYQFSIFGGWQLANNALYMYPHLQIDRAKIPNNCRKLDNLTREYFDSIPTGMKGISPIMGAIFIQYEAAPLKQYVNKYSAWRSDTLGGIQSWGEVAPVFGMFGKYLIREHPIAYAKHFLVPNAMNYFVPPLEKLEMYNLGADRVYPIAANWFGYKTTSVKSISKDLQGILLYLFPVFFTVLNLYFAGCSVFLLLLGGRRRLSGSFLHGLTLIGLFLLVNFAFSVLASPIVFRYQVFPMIVFFTFSLLTTDLLINSGYFKLTTKIGSRI